MVLLDLVFFVLMMSMVIEASVQGQVYSCSKQLFWVSASLLIYQATFIIRNITIVFVIWVAKINQPVELSRALRVLLNFFDSIFLVALVGWNTYVMTQDEVNQCKDEDPLIKKYWILSLVFLAYFWIYAALTIFVWIIFYLSCLICGSIALFYSRNQNNGFRQASVSRNLIKELEKKKKAFSNLTGR